MTEPTTDRQLLWEYVSQQSPRAFEALVQRHADLVFATVMRRLGDVEPAQEVAQNVFIALARKAGRFRVEVSLAGWLHKTAVLESRRWWRDDLRRQRREQAAANLETTMQEDASLLKSLAPVLDEALLELRATDRQALMLRYFEKRNYREVGVLLGVGEDAARKRIDRALDQLTRFFRRRGYAVPTAAATASVLVGSVQSAPVNLAASITRAALAAGSSAPVTVLGLLLARFLGLGRLQASMVALTICAVPVAHQWHCARTELAQEQKLRAKLFGLEEARSQLEHRVTQLEGRLRNTEARAAASKSATMEGEGAELYFWDENSDYVRLPKSMIPRLRFGDTGESPFPFSYNRLDTPEGQKPVIGKDGTPSTVLLDALGLTAEESQKVSELCRNVVSEYFSLVLPRCYVTNKGYSVFWENQESRTWVTPELSEEGEMLRQRLHAGLAQFMDQERAAVFFDQTSNQFRFYWNNLGSLELDLTVYRTSPSTIGWFTEYRHGGEPRLAFGGYREVPEALQPFARAWQEPTPNSGSPAKQ